MSGPEPALHCQVRRGRLVALACAGVVLAGTFGLSVSATADVLTPTVTAPAAGSTTADTQPNISGAGTIGNTAIVTDKTPNGGVFVCAAVVTADKTWECVPPAPLATGPHTISVAQLDQASSLSASSASVTFTIGSATTSGSSTASSPAPSGTANSSSPRTSTPDTSSSGTGPRSPTGVAPQLGGPTDQVLADVAPKAKSSAASPLAIAAIIALALTFGLFAFLQLRPRRR
ncbi:MAG: Ig-like domain-containing protein [Jatrophihabitantaceae bacterium]